MLCTVALVHDEKMEQPQASVKILSLRIAAILQRLSHKTIRVDRTESFYSNQL